MNEGWKCLECGAVNAPWVAQCSHKVVSSPVTPWGDPNYPRTTSPNYPYSTWPYYPRTTWSGTSGFTWTNSIGATN